VKQILCILACSPETTDTLITAYGLLDAQVHGNAIVLITVTDGDDGFLY